MSDNTEQFDYSSEESRQELIEAIKSGSLEAVRRFVDCAPQPASGTLALAYAFRYGRTDVA